MVKIPRSPRIASRLKVTTPASLQLELYLAYIIDVVYIIIYKTVICLAHVLTVLPFIYLHIGVAS